MFYLTCIRLFIQPSSIHVYTGIHERQPQSRNLFIKVCIYSYLLKLQAPSKYSPFDAINLWKYFFHCSKQFLNLSILMTFSVSTVFCFISFTSKHILWRTFFIQGNNKKKAFRWDWVNRDGRAWGHAIFGQKLLSVHCGMGR